MGRGSSPRNQYEIDRTSGTREPGMKGQTWLGGPYNLQTREARGTPACRFDRKSLQPEPSPGSRDSFKTSSRCCGVLTGFLQVGTRGGPHTCVLEISVQLSTSSGPKTALPGDFPASGILFSQPSPLSPLTAPRDPRRPRPGAQREDTPPISIHPGLWSQQLQSGESTQ